MRRYSREPSSPKRSRKSDIANAFGSPQGVELKAMKEKPSEGVEKETRVVSPTYFQMQGSPDDGDIDYPPLVSTVSEETTEMRVRREQQDHLEDLPGVGNHPGEGLSVNRPFQSLADDISTPGKATPAKSELYIEGETPKSDSTESTFNPPVQFKDIALSPDFSSTLDSLPQLAKSDAMSDRSSDAGSVKEPFVDQIETLNNLLASPIPALGALADTSMSPYQDEDDLDREMQDLEGNSQLLSRELSQIDISLFPDKSGMAHSPITEKDEQDEEEQLKVEQLQLSLTPLQVHGSTLTPQGVPSLSLRETPQSTLSFNKSALETPTVSPLKDMSSKKTPLGIPSDEKATQQMPVELPSDKKAGPKSPVKAMSNMKTAQESPIKIPPQTSPQKMHIADRSDKDRPQETPIDTPSDEKSRRNTPIQKKNTPIKMHLEVPTDEKLQRRAMVQMHSNEITPRKISLEAPSDEKSRLKTPVEIPSDEKTARRVSMEVPFDETLPRIYGHGWRTKKSHEIPSYKQSLSKLFVGFRSTKLSPFGKYVKRKASRPLSYYDGESGDESSDESSNQSGGDRAFDESSVSRKLSGSGSDSIFQSLAQFSAMYGDQLPPLDKVEQGQLDTTFDSTMKSVSEMTDSTIEVNTMVKIASDSYALRTPSVHPDDETSHSTKSLVYSEDERSQLTTPGTRQTLDAFDAGKSYSRISPNSLPKDTWASTNILSKGLSQLSSPSGVSSPNVFADDDDDDQSDDYYNPVDTPHRKLDYSSLAMRRETSDGRRGGNIVSSDDGDFSINSKKKNAFDKITSRQIIYICIVAFIMIGCALFIAINVTDVMSDWNKPGQAKLTNSTSEPTLLPTKGGESSLRPTTSPSVQPAQEYTSAPTTTSTDSPSSSHTDRHTTDPTFLYSGSPSTGSTPLPSQSPTKRPSSSPTKTPSQPPTKTPSNAPTLESSGKPTYRPSIRPTETPSTAPSRVPSKSPSTIPSQTPSKSPSIFPTLVQSDLPSKQPTGIPSESPSDIPSHSPSMAASDAPTEKGSQRPTAAPTLSPTRQYSQNPTTSRPTSENSPLFNFLVNESFDEGKTLLDPTSPQFQAFTWLSSDVNLLSYSKNRLKQRYAMATLFYSTDGDGWMSKRGWLTDSNECSWFSKAGARGTCDEDNALKNLELDYNDLNGTLPPELGLLSNSLERIDIYGGPTRMLSGTIPTEIGYLTNLVLFHLPHNMLIGSLPTEIGNLKSMQQINLSGNKLNGHIPSELGMLIDVFSLDIRDNEFTGSLPTEIGQMEKCRRLRFDNNEISGPLPSEIGQLRRLQELSGQSNSLTSISSDLGRLAFCEKINLHDNKIGGTLQSQLGALNRLRKLLFSKQPRVLCDETTHGPFFQRII